MIPSAGSLGPAAVASWFDSFDQSRDQLLSRLEGMGDTEYLWEPAPDSWSVRSDGDVHAVDFREDDPDPAPITTIAWRLWHIAVDCMDSYTSRAFGTRGTDLEGLRFVGTADEAREMTEAAIENFRHGMSDLGHAIWRPLGEDWGRYGKHSHFDLALHAHRELTHHGAEVGVLRDLYRWTHA